MAADNATEERSERDHYSEAADGLEAAAKALRACGDEEASEDEGYETPREKQPKDLKGAAKAARSRFAQTRKARSSSESGKPDTGDSADDGNKPLPTHK